MAFKHPWLLSNYYNVTLAANQLKDSGTTLSACHAHTVVHNQGARGDSWSYAAGNAFSLYAVVKTPPTHSNQPVPKLAIIKGELVKINQFETRNQRRLAKKCQRKTKRPNQ